MIYDSSTMAACIKFTSVLINWLTNAFVLSSYVRNTNRHDSGITSEIQIGMTMIQAYIFSRTLTCWQVYKLMLS